jgi:hypothetical protein
MGPSRIQAVSDEPQSKLTTEMSEDLLPFVVELWTDDGSEVEYILARVQTASLGHAVFIASRADLPTRRLTLRRGARVIADSSSTSDFVQHT